MYLVAICIPVFEIPLEFIVLIVANYVFSGNIYCVSIPVFVPIISGLEGQHFGVL